MYVRSRFGTLLRLFCTHLNDLRYGSYSQASPLEVREVAQVGAAHKTTGAWRAAGSRATFCELLMGQFNSLLLNNLIVFGLMWAGWAQVNLA
jgi:hypothetical protein